MTLTPMQVTLVAELIADLQVPCSIAGSGKYLGTVPQRWADLRAQFNLFGWMTAEQIKEKMLASEPKKNCCCSICGNEHHDRVAL